MVIVDANVLIFAYWQQFAHHEAARDWLGDALGGQERVGFPVVSLLAYLRVTTAGKVITPTPTIEAACTDMDQCLAGPAAIVLADGPRTWPVLRGQLIDNGIRGNLTTDAYLSALAVEHDAAIVTFDRDFARFTNVRKIFLG